MAYRNSSSSATASGSSRSTSEPMESGRLDLAHLSPAIRGSKNEGSGLQTLAEIERLTVREHLRRAGGNKSRAARTLGISREGLRKKLARWRET